MLLQAHNIETPDEPHRSCKSNAASSCLHQPLRSGGAAGFSVACESGVGTPRLTTDGVSAAADGCGGDFSDCCDQGHGRTPISFSSAPSPASRGRRGLTLRPPVRMDAIETGAVGSVAPCHVAGNGFAKPAPLLLNRESVGFSAWMDRAERRHPVVFTALFIGLLLLGCWLACVLAVWLAGDLSS